MFNLFGQDVNAFSLEGRLLQVQYALKATKKGAASIGIFTPHGVILAAEKPYASPLMVPTDKIMKVDKHIVCTAAGITADARCLVEPARKICARYWLTYNELMPMEHVLEYISQRASLFVLGLEDSGNSSDSSDSNSDSDHENTHLRTPGRPYGVAFLFAGICHEQPQLWYLEPSGEFEQVAIKAIGLGSDAAEEKLQEAYHVGMHLDEAMTLALTTLEEAMGQKLTSSNLELKILSKGPLCHKFTEAELEMVIASSQGGQNSPPAASDSF